MPQRWPCRSCPKCHCPNIKAPALARRIRLCTRQPSSNHLSRTPQPQKQWLSPSKPWPRATASTGRALATTSPLSTRATCSTPAPPRTRARSSTRPSAAATSTSRSELAASSEAGTTASSARAAARACR